nr:nucleolin-like [Aegilops tauschii subsp. strangulata]
MERRVIDWDEYEDHMLWYDDGIKHRLRLRPQWTTADSEDLFDDASENEAYNKSIRQLQGGFREYGPLMNRVSSELNKSIFHASDALSVVPGTQASENKLRETVKPLASSSHAASSSRAVQDDEEESDDDHDAEEDEEEGAEEEHGEEEEEDDEEEEEYDDDDGPPTTQPTQREKRNVPKKDWKSPSPFQKPRPTARKKTAAEKRSKDNEDRKSKRGRKD